MSGIFAYIGREDPKKILAEGLSSMQHRGGEANGVAVKVKDGFSTARVTGGVPELCEASKHVAEGSCGIAQTAQLVRTSSKTSVSPASNNMYAVVCDGSIQNFRSLKRWSREPFAINTDEELLLACLCITDLQDKLELIRKVRAALLGAPGFAFISADESAVYACAGDRPLFAGMGESGVYLSSELSSLCRFCDKYAAVGNGEIVKLRGEKLSFFDAKARKMKKSFLPVPDKPYFESDFSLDNELYSCSVTAKDVYRNLIKNSKLSFDFLKLSRRSVEKLSRIILVGEGSSYNSALYCRNLLELMTDIPSFAYTSGEFMYAKGVLDKNTLLVAVTERGEGYSTLASVRRAKAAGAKTLAVTASELSSAALMCDKVLCTGGDFPGDISLSSFIAQSFSLALFSLYIGVKDSVVNDLYLNVAIKMAEIIAGKIASAVKENTAFASAVNMILSAEKLFFCGVGTDYAASREAAEKLRRISCRSCSALPLGELSGYDKASLSGAVVLAFVTNKDRAPACDIMLSRIKTLGAKIIMFTTDNIEEELSSFDTVISVNDTLPIYDALSCVAASYKLSLLLRSADEECEDNTAAAS